MARFIAQLIVAGAQTVGRAFTQALRQEYQATMAARQAAEAAGRDGPKAARNQAFSGMSFQEAKQILNVEGTEDFNTLQKRYQHLFKVNDKKSGGSFYLQSKVVRAKERLELEMDIDLESEPVPEEKTSNQSTDKPS